MKTAESVLQRAREKGIPVLILTAQDQCALRAVYEYKFRCVMANCSKNHIAEIKAIHEDFKKWRTKNPDKVKLPD